MSEIPRRTAAIATALAIAVSGTVWAGCGDDDSEDISNAITEAVDDAQEQFDEATQDLDSTAQEQAEKAQDKAKRQGDKIQDAIDQALEEAGN